MSATSAAAEMPLRVLVVDDCRDNADSLQVLLTQWGFDARSTYDVAAAVVTAESFRPDVVVADIAMPVASGLELANRLRDAERRPDLLIAISGYADEAHRSAAAQAGFDFYLVKPPDLAQLRDLLDSARRVAGHCRRITVHADRVEVLTNEVRRLIDDIRAELRLGLTMA
jgi:CheY-like chemotaxis protein